jgi:hypothetical protein
MTLIYGNFVSLSLFPHIFCFPDLLLDNDKLTKFSLLHLFLFYREEMEVAKLKATLEAVELKMRQDEQKKAQEEEQKR